MTEKEQLCHMCQAHKKAIWERDEARAWARSFWREDYLGDDAPEWLTVDGPEDIAQRERQQQRDIAKVNALFAHLTTDQPARGAGQPARGAGEEGGDDGFAVDRRAEQGLREAS